ncbi:MAG: hypothetical protein AB1505_34940, partial [Candidatus Latescibacterota bacterium]
MSLEQALARSQADAEAALEAARGVARGLQLLRRATQQGVLKEIPRALEGAQQALAVLGERLAAARQGWRFEEPGYWDGGGYVRELVETARQMGVDIHLQDDLLYCYPSLVRILPGDQVAVIDRAREKRLRPSVLVEHLRQLQARPVRFRSEAFLESLRGAYGIAVRTRKGREEGSVIPLAEI